MLSRSLRFHSCGGRIGNPESFSISRTLDKDPIAVGDPHMPTTPAPETAIASKAQPISSIPPCLSTLNSRGGSMSSTPCEDRTASCAGGNEVSQVQAASLLPKVWQMFQIGLFIWSWLKCWWDLIYNLFMLSRGYDIICAASALVQLVGLVMTNVLGCVSLRKDSLQMALVAAMDLDTPVLTAKHAQQVVEGEHVQAYEDLRLRSSVWRSLPLAMLMVFVAFRTWVELPACQLMAIVPVFMTTLRPDLAKHSLFIRGWVKSDIEPSRLYMANTIRNGFGDLSIPPRIDDTTERSFLYADHWMWNRAAHCGQSEWKPVLKELNQEEFGTWFRGGPILLDDQYTGGFGNGNVYMMQVVFWRHVVSNLYAAEDRLGSLAQGAFNHEAEAYAGRLAGTAASATGVISWKSQVDFLGKLIGMSEPPTSAQHVRSISQTRPWKLDLLGISLQDGAIMQLAQALVLLLVATLPIAKAILRKWPVSNWLDAGLIRLHVGLDLTLLVGVAIFCANARFAFEIQKFFSTCADQWVPVLERFLRKMDDDKDGSNCTFARKRFCFYLVS